MFMNFPNYTIRSLYLTKLVEKEPNNFQQLSKLIELKLIFTTWPHWLTLRHKEISTCPKSSLITLKMLNFT